jgi:hypothetical protein
MEFDDGLPHKRRFLVIAVEQGHLRVRQRQSQWYARQPSAAADIQHRRCALDMRHHGQTVE